MKNFDDFITYLNDNNISKKIFEKAKDHEKNTVGQPEMFMAFFFLLEEYHKWVNA